MLRLKIALWSYIPSEQTTKQTFMMLKLKIAHSSLAHSTAKMTTASVLEIWLSLNIFFTSQRNNEMPPITKGKN